MSYLRLILFKPMAVHYLPGASNPAPPYSQAPPPQAYGPYTTPYQSSTNYGSYSQTSSTHLAVSALTGQPHALQNTQSSPAGNVMVTPEMATQVHMASESNPALKELLHVAATGRATPEQMKSLGFLIQSLGSSQQHAGISDASAPHIPAASQPPQHRVRDFDVVIEFQEKPHDRWIVPRGPVVCERADAGDNIVRTPHIRLSMPVPFPSTASSIASRETSEPLEEPSPPQVATFRISRVSHALWTVLVAWAGGEQHMAESRAALKEIISKAPERTYLQYRLPEGPLSEQIQSAVAPPYGTKSIVPGTDGARTKRKASTRKVSIAPALTPAPSKPPVKRKQSIQLTPTTPSRIACRACGQTDVPLLMGGRYCRTCIQSGRAVDEIPQVPARQTHVFSAAAQRPGVESDKMAASSSTSSQLTIQVIDAYPSSATGSQPVSK